MVRFISLLAKHLEPFREQYQPILLLDCCSAHLSAAVLAAASNQGIWIVIIPARLTWLLQPLDVYIFRNFKRELQKHFRRLIKESIDGRVSDHAWLLCVTRVAATFLSSLSWRRAFVLTGATGAQDSLSRALASYKMQPMSEFTAAHVRLLFPRNRIIDTAAFLAPVLAACQAARAK
jgi:hypothetical protein